MTRDKVMGLLWSDCDEASARHLLSDSLYVLRKALGDDAVLGSGEFLRLNPELVRCDVWSFEEALARGDPEVAVEFYAGPLLDGFYLGGEGEFEHWVETERQRLAEGYAKALESLAERAEAESDHPGAVEWWRRLVAYDPFNSRVALRLMQAMAESGDRANAVQYAREHARLLRDELGMEPDANMAAFAERLRREPAPVTESVVEPRTSEHPGAEVSAGAISETVRPEETGGGLERLVYHRIRQPHSLIWVCAVVLAASAGVVAAYFALGGRFERSLVETAAIDPANRVAVLPFSYRGGEEFAYLGEGMVDLLSATLEGAGELRSVNPRAVLGILAQEGGASPDVERARVVASRLGAGRYVVGEVVEVSGRLRISARLYDSGAGLEQSVQAAAEGDPGEFYELVDELTAQLLVGLQGGPGGRLVHVASLTTDSLAALKVYLKGQIELRAGRLESAFTAFQRAIEIDSSFALAYYGISVAASWEGLSDQYLGAAEKAVQYSSRLPWREQRILEANLAFLEGAAGETERAYREVLNQYPDDVEALTELGSLLELYNPLNGRSVVEARGPLRRALSYEPDNWGALTMLARVEASEGNWSAVDSLLRRAYGDRPVHFAYRALLAFAREDRAAQEQVLADANEIRIGNLIGAATGVAVWGRDLRAALNLSRLMAQRDESLPIRVFAHLHTAQLELGLGRRRAAELEVARAAQIDPASALEYEALWSLAPFLPTSRATLEAARFAGPLGRRARSAAVVDSTTNGRTSCEAARGRTPPPEALPIGLSEHAAGRARCRLPVRNRARVDGGAAEGQDAGPRPGPGEPRAGVLESPGSRPGP